jgi:hypothetical protein
MGSITSTERTPGEAVVSVSVAQADWVHAIAHRAVLAARGGDESWDTPLETALAAINLARHTHAYLSDAESALEVVLRWWQEGEPRRTSSDVTALALAARASAELQRQEPDLLSAAIQAVDDLANRDATVAPFLHLALCAWALDPLITDRGASPWPALRTRLDHPAEIGVNVPLRQYSYAIAQSNFNPNWLAQELVGQIGTAAGPSDACILIWLTTVACEKVSRFIGKEDSGLQVLFRHRGELTERLAGEIDDRTFREPDPSEFDPEDTEMTLKEQIYLSSFEAGLLDFGLASKEPGHPWLTYEEAGNLFDKQAAHARAELDSIRRRLHLYLATLAGLLGFFSSLTLWLLLRRAHVVDSVANPAAVGLASLLFMTAVKSIICTRYSDLCESIGVFFASLALLAAAVAVNQSLRKPYIGDVGGLIAGTLIATAAAVVWGFVKRSE